MFPKPVLILPLFRTPVPVILAWCCVILVAAMRASATVPLVKLVAFSAVKLVPTPL